MGLLSLRLRSASAPSSLATLAVLDENQGQSRHTGADLSSGPTLSDTWGNAALGTVTESLDTGVDAFVFAAGGLEAVGLSTPLSQGNEAMLRVMRRAEVEWDAPALARLNHVDGGRALSPQLQVRFGEAFGHDFSHVRVHTSSVDAQAAQALSAHAFAMGAHIFFGPGEWAPGTPTGDRLLAHELTHVVQFDEGRLPSASDEGVSSPSDPSEQEAYANEDRILGRLEPMSSTAELEADSERAMATSALTEASQALGGGLFEAPDQQGADSQSDAPQADIHRDAAAGSSQSGAQPQPEGPQTFEVDQEVLVEVRIGRFRRGTVLEVGPPTTSPPFYRMAEEHDGWEYTVAFEGEGGLETDRFFSFAMRSADELSDAGPRGPGQPDQEEEEGEAGEAGAVEGGEGEQTQEGEAEVEAEDQGQGSEGGEGSGSGSVQTAGFTPTPEPAGPSQSTIDSVSVSPALSLDPSSGEDAWFQEMTGMSFSENVSQVNQGFEEMVDHANASMQSFAEAQSSHASEATSEIAAAADQTSADTASMTSAVDQSVSAAQESVIAASQQSVAEVSSQASATQDRIDTLSDAQKVELQARAATLEAAVQAKAETYAVEIDTFIQTEITALEQRLDAIITLIEEEAKTEEAEAREEASKWENTTSGAEDKADELAVQTARAKTKARYAKAMKRIREVVIEELKAQTGDPSKVLADQLTAPTLAEVFPASTIYEANVEQKQKEAKEKSELAGKQYGDLTSQASEQQQQTLDDTNAQAQATVDETQTAVDQSLVNIDGDLQDKQHDAVAITEEQRATAMEYLAQLVQSEGGAGMPDANSWSSFVQEWEAEEEAKDQEFLDGLEADNQGRMEDAQDGAQQVTDEAQAATEQVQATTEEQQASFVAGVQEGATQTFADLEHVAADTEATGAALYQQAVEAGDAALTQLDTDGAAFLEGRVKQSIGNYTAEADGAFEAMSEKMNLAIESSEKSAKQAEQTDRRSRRKNAHDAMGGLWGLFTDEEQLMTAVSGTTKVQAWALQAEYAEQEGDSLKEDIEYDTSGSLERSLLAWIRGDETTAVIESLKYGNEGFWGPDTDVVEISMRGLSEEGRLELQGDEEFIHARDELLTTLSLQCDPGGTMWGWDVHDLDAITTLTDLSLSKEESELMADVIRLSDAMDRAGTDEQAVYDILGKYDQEGTTKIAAAYAKYRYERVWGDGTWESLSDEEKQQYEQTTLKTDIDWDFGGSERDKAMALSEGNKGAADAVDLYASSRGSNDYKAAYDAMQNDDMWQGDDWLKGVESTEQRAEFMRTIGAYQDDMDSEEMWESFSHHTDQDQLQANADNWDENKAKTSEFITEEFDGWRDSDQTIHRVLQDELETGDCDVEDLMDLGVEGMGTREVFVKEALDKIAGESDINVKLMMLDDLGAHCSSFISREIKGLDPVYQQAYWAAADEGVARLPTWVQEIEGHGNLLANIRNVVFVLSWEEGGGGGQLMDWEIILGKGLMRTDNARDYWEMAQQNFLSMLDEEDAEDPSPEVLRFVEETQDELFARIDAEWTSGEDESSGDLDNEDVLIAQYLKAKNFYEANEGPWYDEEGWLVQDPATSAPSEETQKKWEDFQAVCDRVELAKTDLDDANKALADLIGTIIAITAAVIIAVVSAGTATAASAAIIAVAVTAVAGAATIITKMVIHGDRYGPEEMAMDIAKALADTVVMAATAGLGSFQGINKLLDGVVKSKSLAVKLLAEAGKALPGEIVNLLFNEQAWDSGNYDGLIQDLVIGLFAAAAGGAIGELGEATKKGMDIPKRVENLFDTLLSNLGGVIADPRKWEDPNLGWDLLKGIAQGLVVGELALQIKNAQLGRLNAPGYQMTQADYDRIAALDPGTRDWFLENLDPRHATSNLPDGHPAVQAQDQVDDEADPTSQQQDGNKTKTDPDASDQDEPAYTGGADATLTLLNQGTVEELQQIKGIGPKRAQEIVDYRTKNGQFKSLSDVNAMSGHISNAVQGHNPSPLDILNQGSVDQLKTLPNIDEVKAKAIVEYRKQHGDFDNVADIKQVYGVGMATVSDVSGLQKLSMLDSESAAELQAMKSTFKEQLQELKADPSNDGVKDIELMRKIVEANPSAYLLKGDAVPMSVLEEVGAFSRVVSASDLYKYYLSDAAKLDLETTHNIKSVEDYVKHFSEVKSSFSLSDIKSGAQLKGGGDVGLGWWAPKSQSSAGTLGEFVKDLGLESSRYKGGAVRFSIPPGGVPVGTFKKPTVFDGIGFDEHVPSNSKYLGTTSGGVPEVVAGPIEINTNVDFEVF